LFGLNLGFLRFIHSDIMYMYIKSSKYLSQNKITIDICKVDFLFFPYVEIYKTENIIFNEFE